MNVTVDTVNPAPSAMSTIITASGLNEKGDRVTFGGDWRPMRDLAEIIEYEGEVECHVESWQVLSVVPAEVKPPKVDAPQFESLFTVVAETEVDDSE